ncbi:DMT family transporter [Halopseudomonas nanhaiensis]|uniref:DMT family transporter n=1 Tax=Halopseudomonas nanhaiensis TaxID=2830842 RepID=UPI001CBEC1CC|nr:DMT family transporter [Halopseudomonas nanhaiensis]UAW99960.1 DMT family transporter [Halopseudomonas nanhaiensis]
MTHGRALASMHVAALMFGMTGIFGKLATAGPGTIVLGRAVFAVVALLLFAQLFRQRMLTGLTLTRLLQLALCGLLLGTHWLTFFHSVKIAGVGIATLGFASFPAFVVLLEWAGWREAPSNRDLLKVALIVIGLILVTPHFELGAQATTGLLWAVLSGLCFAAVSVGNRLTSVDLSPVQVACWQNLFILLCLVPISGTALLAMPPLDWLWIALLGLLCTGLAHGLFVASLAVLKARVASLFFALEPVYGILFAWYLFGEQPTLRMLIGGALIVGALVLVKRPPDPA